VPDAEIVALASDAPFVFFGSSERCLSTHRHGGDGRRVKRRPEAGDGYLGKRRQAR
jgi:hypothetical protein